MSFRKNSKISYRDLAERLKMSFTPVIQALKQLEFQGLVDTSQTADIRLNP